MLLAATVPDNASRCAHARTVQALLSTDALATTPFLILGNKIDIPRAASDGTS